MGCAPSKAQNQQSNQKKQKDSKKIISEVRIKSQTNVKPEKTPDNANKKGLPSNVPSPTPTTTNAPAKENIPPAKKQRQAPAKRDTDISSHDQIDHLPIAVEMPREGGQPKELMSFISVEAMKKSKTPSQRQGPKNQFAEEQNSLPSFFPPTQNNALKTDESKKVPKIKKMSSREGDRENYIDFSGLVDSQSSRDKYLGDIKAGPSKLASDSNTYKQEANSHSVSLRPGSDLIKEDGNHHLNNQKHNFEQGQDHHLVKSNPHAVDQTPNQNLSESRNSGKSDSNKIVLNLNGSGFKSSRSQSQQITFDTKGLKKSTEGVKKHACSAINTAFSHPVESRAPLVDKLTASFNSQGSAATLTDPFKVRKASHSSNSGQSYAGSYQESVQRTSATVQQAIYNANALRNSTLNAIKEVPQDALFTMGELSEGVPEQNMIDCSLMDCRMPISIGL